MNRRQFLVRAGALAGVTLVADRTHAQEPQAQASNLGAMDQSAARSVRRPPKPNSHPLLTDRERDQQIETKVRCQCGCTLDVYTCRTTDFSCQVSPAMHADIKSLVDGGYSAQEILDSFVDTYGERVLMAPRPQGFNLFGYIAPFAAFAIGAGAVVAVLRGWGKTIKPAPAPGSLSATPEELARLDAAIRNDG
jgi:cytochrome c-type biogenesis protein CcmH